jgi:hypothetical protein
MAARVMGGLTLADALNADPFPLPFNGTNWPAQSCTSAP